MFCCRLTRAVALVCVRVIFVTIFVLLAGIAYHVKELERKSSVNLLLLHFHENKTAEFFNGCVVVNWQSAKIFFIVMCRTRKQLIYIKASFWACLQICENRLLFSSCLFVHPSSDPTRRVLVKFFYLVIFQKSFEKIKASLKSGKNNGYFARGSVHVYISLNFFIMRNVSNKSCGENKKTHFMFSNFFFENCAVYEITWQNTVDPELPQTTVWYMGVACWIPNATLHTQSQNMYCCTTTTVRDGFLKNFRI